MIKKYVNRQQGTGLSKQISAIFLLLLLAGGCTTVRPSGSDGTAGGKSGDSSAAAVDNAVAKEAVAGHPILPKPQPRPEDYPVAPFPEDTLYQLLVAEVAGYRGDYEMALEKYIRIANETRDAGVAARATRLASYLKRPDLALQTAIIWADADPESLDAHRHAADLLMRSGDLEGAILHMEAVKNLGGLATFDIFAYRAANLDDEGREALLTAVTRMLERYPGDEQLTFAKAVLLEQKGQLEDSLALADQLLLTDTNINVVILKVNTLKDLHRSSDAITFLGGTIDDLATRDNSPRQDVLRRLRLIYARFLFEDKQLEQARAQYEIVHAQMPNDGDILFALALIGMEQGNDAAARDYLEQMIRWNRRVGEARYYLGSIAEKNEDFESALKNYRQAGRGYEFLPAQGRIAHLLVEQGRIKEMRAHLANMRADVPDRADQLLMIEAQAFIERGMQTEAFSVMDAAVANDVGNDELLYFRAMAGEKFDRLDILERDLQTMIENDPDNSDAMNALGYTLADKTDRFDEALLWIERALAIKPNEPAYIDSLGWVQYRLKNFDSAIENLRKALEMFPNDEVAAHLGEALWAVGDESEAKKIWEKFLEIKPDSEILKRVMDRFLSK